MSEPSPIIATKATRAIQPFVSGHAVPYSASFKADEFDRLRNGLIPEAMEDKWFIYYEAPHLYLHRSWTGQAVYRVHLDETDSGATVREAHCAVENTSPAYEAAVLDFLIANLLLGQATPFPLPPGADGADGILQHHIAGTGYPEAKVRSTRWQALRALIRRMISRKA